MVHSSYVVNDVLDGWRPQQVAHCYQWAGLLFGAGDRWQCVGHFHWLRERYRLFVGPGEADTEVQGYASHSTAHYERQLSEQPRRRKLMKELGLIPATREEMNLAHEQLMLLYGRTCLRYGH